MNKKRLKEIFSNMANYIIKFTLLVMFAVACFSLGAATQKYSTPYLHHDWLKYTTDEMKQISDRISPEQVQVYSDKIIIYGNYQWAEYANTDSMLPLLDYGSNGIYIEVGEETELRLGDVISFSVEGYDNPFIHRIVRIGVDDEGTYYKTKGDNLRVVDPFKVRKENIHRVMVGVLW